MVAEASGPRARRSRRPGDVVAPRALFRAVIAATVLAMVFAFGAGWWLGQRGGSSVSERAPPVAVAALAATVAPPPAVPAAPPTSASSTVARVEAVLDATYPEPSLPPLERLERFIETRSSAVGQRLGILRLVLSDQFMLALPAQGSQRLGACVQKTRAFIIECVRTGQAAGEIRADLPAEPLAVLVMGTVQMLALAPSNPERRIAEPRLIIETLLALLRPIARPPERPATKPRGTPKPSGARAKRVKS